MNIFKSKEKKDLELGKKFQKRFKKMLVVKDYKTGNLSVMLRSENDAILTIKTLQKHAENIKQKNDKV